MPQSKVVVITGASAGIGAAIARRLAADGHRLVLAARRAPELEAVAREAEQGGSPRAIAVRADVTREPDVEAIARAAVDAFGGFDVWINNAGRGIARSVLDLTAADLDEVMTINLKSALYGMQTAAKQFLEQGHGHVINVSSFLGRVPLATHRSAYNAAKAALNALTANLRVDLRARNPEIHVTLVMPGMVATDFARNAIGASQDAVVRPGGPVQTVEQVADVVAGVIESPVAEVYTNPASIETAARYFADVAAFENTAPHPWRAAPGPAK